MSKPRFRGRVKSSSIYLLPNMITLSSMCCGFYAIVQALSANFHQAGIAILFSMILDSLDGRVARMTNTSSPFGAELDSIADMVAFGAAPAIIVFTWGAHQFGYIGWFISFAYCACAALRLARFNVNTSVADKRYFQGMPSPSAAALVVGLVFLAVDYNINSSAIKIAALVVTIVASVSMVSNIKFYSFKEIHFHQAAPFRTLLGFLMLLVLVSYYPDLVVYSFFILYTIISYVFWAFGIGYSNKALIGDDDFCCEDE